MRNLLSGILCFPIVRRVRQNHALEHAAVHILSRRQREVTIYARSGPNGLVIYGDLPTAMVAEALTEALGRLEKGERELAIHPNCGTNLVTSGSLAGLAATAALGIQRIGKKKKGVGHLLGSMPLVFLAATGALIAAQPLGQALQLYVTTESDVSDLRITSVTRHNQGRLVFHTVRTGS